MPIFCVKSVKIYTGQKNLHGYTCGSRNKYQVWVGQINLYIFACVLSCKFLSTFMCRESLKTFWPWGGFRVGSKPEMVPILLGKFSSSNWVGEPDQVKTRTTIYSAWNVADSLGWVDLPRRMQKLSETMNLVKTTISHIKEARMEGILGLRT